MHNFLVLIKMKEFVRLAQRKIYEQFFSLVVLIVSSIFQLRFIRDKCIPKLMSGRLPRRQLFLPFSDEINRIPAINLSTHPITCFILKPHVQKEQAQIPPRKNLESNSSALYYLAGHRDLYRPKQGHLVVTSTNIQNFINFETIVDDNKNKILSPKYRLSPSAFVVNTISICKENKNNNVSNIIIPPLPSTFTDLNT